MHSLRVPALPTRTPLRLVIALLGPGVLTAHAGTSVSIVAVVAPDLHTVSGTLTVSSDLPFTLIDPLEALPDPDTDELVQATFPGIVSHGLVEQTLLGPGQWAFTATLPRRYGDIGATGHFGLYANGGWYPQPMTPEGMPEANWDVVVTLPAGTAGSIGDVAGAGTLHWVGRGERASLAALPNGVVTPVDAAGVHLDLLTRGRPRHVLTTFLASQLPGVVPDSGPRHGVVIETPLRRRLVQPGVRATYISDRAWRLTPGFRRFHDVAVMHGVASALLDLPDPFARDIAAASITVRYAESVKGSTAEDTLKWVAWIPIVDKMLHGRHTPFITEILEEPLPGDLLHDDLVEVLDPHWPGQAVLAQVSDRYGPGTGEQLGRALEGGLSLDAATANLGIDTAWVNSLRSAMPIQDYVLTVVRSTGNITVRRNAPVDAPAEVVVVVVDGARVPWLAGPGPDTLDLGEAASGGPPVAGAVRPPGSVAIDPDRHIAQTSTARDTWPARFTPVLAAWFSRVDLRKFYFEGFVQVALRRQYDTHFIWKLRAFADEQTLVGGELAYVGMFGPEVDGLRREHQVGVWVSPAVLSARYAPTGGDVGVVGAGVDYTWDNSVARYFPLRGHHLTLGVDAGLAPASGDQWEAVRATGLIYLSPHPRLSLPVELLAGAAGGTVEHRLIDLGGLDGMRSLPPGEVIGNGRLITRIEVRWAAVHNAAIPLFLLWGNELSISGGVEAGSAWVDGKVVAALGGTAGVGWQLSLLGANPSYARVRLGYPLWADGIGISTPRVPQVVLEAENYF